MQRGDWILERTNGPLVLDIGAVQHEASAAQQDEWLHGRLCERFERVVGVDIQAEAAQQLRQEGYEIRVADACEMNLDIVANTVVLGEVLEHVTNPGGLLASARAHCHPDGQVVLTTPNAWGVPRLMRLARGAHGVNAEHVAWYGPTTLRQLCDRVGLGVTECQTTRRDHGGLTRIAQWVDSDLFGGTTWCVVATPE